MITDTHTGRRALRAMALMAAATLAVLVAPTAPASADDAEPFTLTTKVVSGLGFKAGGTVKITLTASNPSTKSVTIPADAQLLATFARDYKADGEKLTGGYVMGGFGDDGTYAYYDYLKDLPSKVAAGASYSTTITYVATAEDVSHGGVFATLSYLPGGHTPSSTFSYATVYAKGGSDLAISGTPTYGKTLTAKPGYTAVWHHSYSYQWLRNGKKITGATKAKYKLTASDVGKKISVKVVARDNSGGWINLAPKSTKTVAAAKLTVKTPTVSGTAKVGKTLTAKASGWTTGTKKSYQWYANGAKVKGATKSTLKITSKQKGKKIVVKVTGKKAGYTTVTKASKSTAKVR